MAGLGDRKKRHDPFFKRAKQDGFAARSVYKLEEIDKKCHVLRRGGRVLDLGCRPGSWLQYARLVCGSDAPLVGLDRTELDPPIPGVRALIGDVHVITPKALLGDLEAFDIVLSDMAPDTSGVRMMDQARSETLFERALEIAEQTLAPRGNFVGKLFQGPDFQNLTKRMRGEFEEVKIVKPEGSRKQSIEMYMVGLRYKGPFIKGAP